MEWGRLLPALFAGNAPVLPTLIGIAAFLIVLGCPMPGRGPRLFRPQDPWRRFKYEARHIIMSRAGDRCEGSVFLAWGRWAEPAVESDQVYPWSRGGPTTIQQWPGAVPRAQPLKGAWKAPWWYVLSLEHRRRSYFPPATDARITAAISAAELAAHATPRARQSIP